VTLMQGLGNAPTAERDGTARMSPEHGHASFAGRRYPRPGPVSAVSVGARTSTAARKGAGGLSRICAVVVLERMSLNEYSQAF